jgi:hypothetical protein
MCTYTDREREIEEEYIYTHTKRDRETERAASRRGCMEKKNRNKYRLPTSGRFRGCMGKKKVH